MAVASTFPRARTAARFIADWLHWFLGLRIAAVLAVPLFSIGIFALALSPRSTLVDLAVLIVIAMLVLVAARVPASTWLEDGPDSLAPLMLLGLLALASTLWSLDAAASLGKSLFLLGACLATLIAIRSAPATPRPVLACAVHGIMIGFLLQIAGVAFETLTDQRIARGVLQAFPWLQEGLGKHVFVSDGVIVRISEAEISRRICVVALLLWPLLLAMHTLLAGRTRIAALALTALCTVVILLWGEHQSSQLGLLASLVALALWRWSPRRALQIAAACWVGLIVLAQPIAKELYAARLHESTWLFRSARDRIVIWDTTADRISKTFWRGIGADATVAARDADAIAAGGHPAKAGEFTRTVSRHAHNFALQVWLELGALGAGLLVLAGLAILRLIARLPPAVGAVAFAELAVVASLLSSSYGVWQIWLQSGIALAAIILAMVHIVITNGSAFAMPRR